MVFWILATALTALACAALYYAAAGRAVNASSPDASDPVLAHQRLQLSEIEADMAAGRLGQAEGVAAKAELAREVLRQRREAGSTASGQPARSAILLSLGAVAIVALATYAATGSPDLPASPLAARARLPADMTMEQAIARIEEQLTRTPDDARGWAAVAPVYMQMERYADAEHAYRRLLELTPPTADTETDLALAILLQNGGVLEGEPRDLLQSAAARDPSHVRSRLFLASDEMRTEDYGAAKAAWEELIALAQGDEPWLETARAGLAEADARLRGEEPAVADAEAIRGMVEGLDARLKSQGGTIDEWTRLVRSRLVLEERDAAQAAYAAARAAYPDPAQRGELDALAQSAGLEGAGV